MSATHTEASGDELARLLLPIFNMNRKYHVDLKTMLEFATVEDALVALQAHIDAECNRARMEAVDALAEYGEQYGFERLDLVVEYQDGTDSGVIPYRKHWNECYDRFIVAANLYKAELAQLSPQTESENK